MCDGGYVTPFGLRSPGPRGPGSATGPGSREEGHTAQGAARGGTASVPPAQEGAGPQASGSASAPGQNGFERLRAGPGPGPCLSWSHGSVGGAWPAARAGAGGGHSPLLPGNPTCGGQRGSQSVQTTVCPRRPRPFPAALRDKPPSRPARPLTHCPPDRSPAPHPCLHVAPPPSCQGWWMRVALSSQAHPPTLLVPPSDRAVRVVPEILWAPSQRPGPAPLCWPTALSWCLSQACPQQLTPCVSHEHAPRCSARLQTASAWGRRGA